MTREEIVLRFGESTISQALSVATNQQLIRELISRGGREISKRRGETFIIKIVNDKGVAVGEFTGDIQDEINHAESIFLIQS